MERVIFAVFYGLGYLLLAVFGGLISLFSERQKPSEPLSLPLEPRLEHTHIVAGSGHGKTQLLQHLIVTHDLLEVARGRRSLIVMDSQGDLLRNILHLAEFSPKTFGGLSERLVYIDPTDIANPPCLNLFDFGLSRLKNYTPLEREEIINGTLSLYEYLFGALLGAELTNRQGVIFRYLASLLMVVPGATIFTLMDFMEEPELVRLHLAKLDPLSARFFETQFFASTFDTTRQQILMRLWGVLSKSRVLARMFSHTENRLNLFRSMNKGSVILINTAKNLLQQEGCSLFGKFCLALIAQATQERETIKDVEKRLPVIAYIDEAHDYFEEGAGIEFMINTARKYRVGMVISHQNLRQFPSGLAATVMASTAIKFAGGVSSDDARALAKEMHCEPEFLQGMRKEKGETRFALYMKNITYAAQEQAIPFGTLERKARLRPEEYEELLRDNRRRYCAPVDPTVLSGSVAFAHGPPAHAPGTFQGI